MDFSENILNFGLVFFDVETTGLDPAAGEAICEIGAVKKINGQADQYFQTLVNPGKPMPQGAFRVHGISDQELKTAPYFPEIVEDFLKFIGTNVVCAYNAGFDTGFINHGLAKIHYPPIELAVIDVFLMAKRLLVLPKYTLGTAANFFGLLPDGGLHRALADAKITAELFLKLRGILEEKNINRLSEYISLFSPGDKIFRKLEAEKISHLNSAIGFKRAVRLKIFSPHNLLREEVINNFNIVEDRGRFCLAYRDARGENIRISLSNVLEIEAI